MIGRRYRLGGALAFALILLIQTPRPAATNGWEHGAVPFETLIEALSFESPAIREQAAHSLGFRGQAEAVNRCSIVWRCRSRTAASGNRSMRRWDNSARRRPCLLFHDA